MARFKLKGNSNYTGYGYGTEWKDGVAYTENQEVAEYLKGTGYTVEEVEEKPAAETPADPNADDQEEDEQPIPVFTCPHCGKAYKTANGLAKHIRMDHPESPEAMTE